MFLRILLGNVLYLSYVVGQIEQHGNIRPFVKMHDFRGTGNHGRMRHGFPIVGIVEIELAVQEGLAWFSSGHIVRETGTVDVW